MLEKARSGIYPSYAPVGYLKRGPNGKRILVPDPNSASVITELYDRFATGKYQILRKSLCTGEFDWDGVTNRGTHQPLVTHGRWQRVQEMLDARADNKTRKVKHDFAFTGVIHCGHCGCYFVGS